MDVTSDKISPAPVFPLNHDISPTPTPLSRQDQEHVSHYPILPTEYIVNSSTPKKRCFNYHQLHHLLGFRSVKKWEDLLAVGQKNISIADTGEVPV